MEYREERSFAVHINLTARFLEDYEGDEDGYAWFEQWAEAVRPQVVRAVFDALRAEPGWQVIAAPRGRDPADAVEVAAERVVR